MTTETEATIDALIHAAINIACMAREYPLGGDVWLQLPVGQWADFQYALEGADAWRTARGNIQPAPGGEAAE